MTGMDQRLGLSLPLVSKIPTSYAHGLAFLFTSSYVGSLYLSQHLFASWGSPDHSPSQTPPTAEGFGEEKREPLPPISATDVDGSGMEGDGPKLGNRDHPLTIKRRMKAAATSTLLSIGGIYGVVQYLGNYTMMGAIEPTLKYLGLPSRFSPPERLSPYLLAPIIMLGPLYAMYLNNDIPFISWKRSGDTWFGMLRREWGLVEFRNYIVGPVTEELVFRSTILAAYLLDGFSLKSLVFGTPLWFGIAHAHHGFETYKRNGRTREAAIRAVVASIFQLTYTTLFGWFASFLYLKTGSVMPPLTAHIYCNVMGIYLPTSAIRSNPHRVFLIWGAYLTGIVGFSYGLWVL
ncbi:hypothetical protein L204_105364 [Cryptococcus depauperatus]|nr:prenyl protein peptidase [Cryptococcus depauperatus CBS 7855]